MRKKKKLFFNLSIIIVLCFLVFSCSHKVDNSINLRLESFAINLSPLKIADTESMQVASLLYSPLVAVNADGSIEPRIAKEWRQIDEKTWEFDLRNDLTFSNGAQLKATDVVASIRKAMQPASPWAWALTNIMHEPGKNKDEINCTGLQALGDYKLRILLTKPDPALLHKLDGPPGWIVPNNAEEGEYGIMPGVGPYTIGNVTPDASIMLEARTSGSVPAPKIKKVVFKYIADEIQTGKMFEAGSIDALSINTPRLLEQLISQQNNKIKLQVEGTLVNIPSERVRIVIVNEQRLKVRGFSSKDVEIFIKGLNSKINRDALIELGKGSLTEPLKTSFPPDNNTYNTVECPNDNELMKLPGVSLTILCESDPYSDLIASIVAKTKVGKVEMTYKGIEKGLLINALVTKDYDLVSILLDANINTPEYWASFFQPGSPFSTFGKQLPEMANFNLGSDEGIKQAGNLIMKYGNWIGLVKERRIFAMRNGVSGVRFTPSGQPRYENIGKSE